MVSGGAVASDELLSSLKILPRFMHAVHRGAFPERSLNELNSTQEKILLMLNDYTSLPMKLLFRKNNLDRGAFSRVVHTLVDAGLVDRTFDPRDRRNIILAITEKGRVHVRDLEPVLHEHFRKRLSVLSEEQKNALLEALKTLNSVVELIEGEMNE